MWKYLPEFHFADNWPFHHNHAWVKVLALIMLFANVYFASVFFASRY